MNSDWIADDALVRAAHRAARGPAPLVAGLVEAWRIAFPGEDAAAALGCTPRALTELSLCLRPRDHSWLEDAQEIAGAVDLDADRLVSFLRAAESVERFRGAHPAGDTVVGRLLAARDRDEADE